MGIVISCDLVVAIKWFVTFGSSLEDDAIVFVTNFSAKKVCLKKATHLIKAAN